MDPAAARRLRRGIALTVLLLALVAGYVLSLATPVSEAVRLRNALLFAEAPRQAFEWTPDHVPADFLVEHRPVDARLQAALERSGALEVSGDWERALALAGFLAGKAKGRGNIDADLYTVIDRIFEGYGACSDFTQSYQALAHAAGLFVREWGFSFDGYGGHGHTLIEVYDRQRGKWLMLDVFNNFHAVRAATGEPLGALEFRDAVRSVTGIRDLAIRKNGPGRPGFAYEAELWDYYYRGTPQWFLWWGNAQQSYDDHPLVRAATPVSIHVRQLAGILAGVQPSMHVVASPENVGARAHMRALKWRLLAAAGAGAVLLVALLWQTLRLLGARRAR